MARAPGERAIEWVPSDASREALETLMALNPRKSRPEVLDTALMLAVFASKMPLRLPVFTGKRQEWQFPPEWRLKIGQVQAHSSPMPMRSVFDMAAAVESEPTPGKLTAEAQAS